MGGLNSIKISFILLIYLCDSPTIIDEVERRRSFQFEVRFLRNQLTIE